MNLSEALQKHTIEKAQGRVETWPVNANRASALPWPCPSGDRYMVLLRKFWRDIPAHSGETELMFEEGHYHEKLIAQRLEEDGWEIWKPRKACSWPAYQITGSLDREGKLPATVSQALGLDKDMIYPLEMKALEPNSWGRINSIADMLNAKQPWLRKYPGQLLMYLWLEEPPTGIFVLKNKVNGNLKYLVMNRDEWDELATDLLNKSKRVNDHIMLGSVPLATNYEERVCSRCEMKSICLPGEAGEGAIPLIEEEVENALKRREELKALVDEYTGLDEYIKTEAKRTAPDGGKIVCGDWEITVKTYPKHYKASEERTLSVTEARIRRLKGATNESGTE